MLTDKRGLNPITCDDIGYTADELEFMAAISAWQNRTGRKFPAWSEVLTVLRGIGYRKQAALMSDCLVYRKRTSRGRWIGR